MLRTMRWSQTKKVQRQTSQRAQVLPAHGSVGAHQAAWEPRIPNPSRPPIYANWDGAIFSIRGVTLQFTLARGVAPRWHVLCTGGEKISRGEFRCLEKWRNFPPAKFWWNSSIFRHRCRGIVFSKKSQALTNAPEPTISCADV